MQPNSKEFLAKVSTENNIGGNKGISTAPTTQSSDSTSCLTYVAGPMAECAAKTKMSVTSQGSELMNDGRGDSALLNKGAN